MAVLLSIFDTRLGPVAFLVVPKNFNDKIIKNTTKLMDFVHETGEFFIQESPEDGIKSVNLNLSIPSKWARGKAEMAQLSIMTTDVAPPIELFKKRMVEFGNQLLQDPDIFIAFYKGNRKEYIPDAEPLKQDIKKLDGIIAQKIEKISGMLDRLHDQVRIDTPTTYAYKTSMALISSSEHVPVPKSALNELKELARAKKTSNLFTVFRKIGDMMKVDMLPCEGDVIKVRIIVKELTPEFIMRTSQVISLPLLFTSGICQEKAGKCSYEAYFAVASNVED
nr:hypothetical protein [Candidatus Sigynarchaeota archaeon]